MSIFSFQPTKSSTNGCDLGWITWWHASPKSVIIYPSLLSAPICFSWRVSQSSPKTPELPETRHHPPSSPCPQGTAESCVNSGCSNVWLIKCRRTFASNPLLLSLDQKIQPREKQTITGEHAMEKQDHKSDLKCERERVGGAGRTRGKKT